MVCSISRTSASFGPICLLTKRSVYSSDAALLISFSPGMTSQIKLAGRSSVRDCPDTLLQCIFQPAHAVRVRLTPRGLFACFGTACSRGAGPTRDILIDGNPLRDIILCLYLDPLWSTHEPPGCGSARSSDRDAGDVGARAVGSHTAARCA